MMMMMIYHVKYFFRPVYLKFEINNKYKGITIRMNNN
jgi:hypothetical protein